MGLECPTTEPDVRPADQPWYRDFGQWKWIGVSIGAMGLGILLLYQWHYGVSLHSQYAIRTIAIKTNTRRNSQLTSDLTGFQDLLDRHTQQKEQVIREIGEFQKELEQLGRRTRGLERVRDQIQSLDAAFAQFRQTEDAFEANLRKLEAAVGTGSRQRNLQPGE